MRAKCHVAGIITVVITALRAAAALLQRPVIALGSEAAAYLPRSTNHCPLT